MSGYGVFQLFRGGVRVWGAKYARGTGSGSNSNFNGVVTEDPQTEDPRTEEPQAKDPQTEDPQGQNTHRQKTHKKIFFPKLKKKFSEIFEKDLSIFLGTRLKKYK